MGHELIASEPPIISMFILFLIFDATMLYN